jgi:hypothetical protein
LSDRFFNRDPGEKFTDIDCLEVCNTEQFESLLNNISVIERLAVLRRFSPHKEFFEQSAVFNWLLDRAIYELALHKMKIVEKTVINEGF